LLDSYGGQAIPLLIFLNGEGDEVDRILGFYPPDKYLPMVEDIFNGVGTYLSLKNKYKSGDKSSDTLNKLSDKCKTDRDPDMCEEIYKDIISGDINVEADALIGAQLFFAKRDLDKGHTELMLDLINNVQDNSLISDAYLAMISYYKSTDDTKSEAKLYKRFSDNMMSDPSILNSYAWRMTELGIYLEDALAKSDLAINLSFDRPSFQSYILDTKAEILWLLGRVDEAIKTINLAIDIDPKSDYFIEQRDKFQNISGE